MSNFGIPSLGTDIVGCISKTGYGYQQRAHYSRLPALKGRPRYRMRDELPSYVVSITIEMSDDEFNGWQTFWKGPVGNGQNAFTIRLTMDDTVAFETYDEAYVVRAVDLWAAQMVGFDRWQVQLTVEVPNSIALQITICDVIYGGPIDMLATDDVWPGPIDMPLPADVIEPCEGVLN